MAISHRFLSARPGLIQRSNDGFSSKIFPTLGDPSGDEHHLGFAAKKSVKRQENEVERESLQAVRAVRAVRPSHSFLFFLEISRHPMISHHGNHGWENSLIKIPMSRFENLDASPWFCVCLSSVLTGKSLDSMAILTGRVLQRCFPLIQRHRGDQETKKMIRQYQKCS